MSESNKEDKKFAIEKYLDQVKILTALATALLISPNAFLIIRKADAEALQVFESAKIFLSVANILFLLSIIMTYFIYSSIVGNVNEGIYDVYRPATRIFSLIQLLGIVVGCVALLIFFFMIA